MIRLRAFSLIETMVVLAIVIVIGIVLVSLLQGYHVILATQQARIAVNASASMTMREIRTAALQADAIVASHDFSGTTYTSDAATLVLSLPSIDAAGSIVAGAHDYVAFYAAGTSAYRIVEAAGGSARPSGTKHLIDTLHTLTFTYPAASPTLATSTTVDIIASSTVRQQYTFTQHLTERIYLRNSTL